MSVVQMPQGCAKKTSKNKVRLVEDENHKVETAPILYADFFNQILYKNYKLLNLFI